MLNSLHLFQDTFRHSSMMINHNEFLNRIKKSLYYGPSNPNRMTSYPLASHVQRMFSETHRNYSINTLDLDAISRLRQQTPCSLILTIIYLERLNQLDPVFLKTVSPSELFLVTLVSSKTADRPTGSKYSLSFRWYRPNSIAITTKWM